MRILIKGGRIVNDGHVFDSDLAIENELIVRPAVGLYDQIIDAKGCYVLPGIIDSHVHFREPGLTQKADIESESRAAAAGGVTTFFDMPNTVPQTTTLEALEEKFQLAAVKSHVNYSFFFGATNDNVHLFSQLDIHRIPGIKLFMGSSTGNMLVDKEDSLHGIFSSAGALPIMAHCEDTCIINDNKKKVQALYGDDPDVSFHPQIRSEQACIVSTAKALELAKEHHARLHVAHVSTRKELELIPVDCPYITAEATVGHLLFSDKDYERLGTRIKVNPSIKSKEDQLALRRALTDGRIATIGTDHAPHLLSEKQGGAVKAVSGMPMLQFSLPSMLELVDHNVLTIGRLVTLMAHRPANLFQIQNRGFLHEGYYADIVIVRPDAPWTVTTGCIQSKCGWSPLEGHSFRWKVEYTFCNGHLVYNQGAVNASYIGQPVRFR